MPDVLKGLATADEAGLHPIKVNTVAMRGANEADIIPLAEFCLSHGYQLRFIEHMPLGPEHAWDRAGLLSGTEILARLREQYELDPAPARGSAPAEEWIVASSSRHAGGRIGVIASVTAPFCAACDRTRLTADGQIRSCLFSHVETDLRSPMRAGADNDELAALWRGAHLSKPAGHGIGDPGFHSPARMMSSIGG